jgi:hypothetical protein
MLTRTGKNYHGRKLCRLETVRFAAIRGIGFPGYVEMCTFSTVDPVCSRCSGFFACQP